MQPLYPRELEYIDFESKRLDLELKREELRIKKEGSNDSQFSVANLVTILVALIALGGSILSAIYSYQSAQSVADKNNAAMLVLDAVKSSNSRQDACDDLTFLKRAGLIDTSIKTEVICNEMNAYNALKGLANYLLVSPKSPQATPEVFPPDNHMPSIHRERTTDAPDGQAH
jgi:hypothetical protein